MTPKVLLYTKADCPYCHRAKDDLRRKGVTEWLEHDVGKEPAHRRRMIQASGGRTTVPQIFINGIHVGGSDDLRALEARGSLDALLGQELPA